MPWPVVTAVVITAILWVVLSRTSFGLRTYAIGANVEAARRAGINVSRHLMLLYVLMGLLAGVTGVVDVARFNTASIAGHEQDALGAIAAVVIGGTSLFGGRGRISGTVVGALIPAVLNNGFIIVGVQPFWQNVAVGCVLLLAVFLDQLRPQGRELMDAKSARKGGVSCAAFLVGLGGVEARASLFVGVSSGHPLEAGAKKASYDVVLITNDTFDPFYITVAAGAKAEAKKQGINLGLRSRQEHRRGLADPGAERGDGQAPRLHRDVDHRREGHDRPAEEGQGGRHPGSHESTPTSPTRRCGSGRSRPTTPRAAAWLPTSWRASWARARSATEATAGIASVDDRHNGFTTQLKQHPKLTFIGSSYDNYDLKDVASKVSATIRRNPDLQGLFSPATNEVIGTANAIQAAGKVGKVKLVGFDASPDEVNMLKRGVVTALVVQKAYLMGQLGVREAVAYLSKNTAPPKKVNLGFVVATKANIGTPLISKYIYRSK